MIFLHLSTISKQPPNGFIRSLVGYLGLNSPQNGIATKLSLMINFKDSKLIDELDDIFARSKE